MATTPFAGSRLIGITPLAALMVSWLPAQSQGPTAEETALHRQIRDQKLALTAARTAGLQAVDVNGTTLTPEHFRRELIFLIGAKQVEGKIADFFIAEQLEEAIAAGRNPKDFDISEEELVADIKKTVGEFQKKNPGIEFWDAVRAQFNLDKDAFLHQRRQTKLFDLVFFPGPANGWPVVTREAIMASASGGDGKQFWDNLEKASVDEKGEPRELPAFWMQLCRGWVQKQLKKWSDIRYPADGLTADICLQVNGKSWGTEAAFESIKSGVFTQDIERAVTEVVIREALRQTLVGSSHYMTDDQFRAEFDEYRQEYDSTPFTTEVIAVAFKGYPSLEAFRQRWRLLRSYEKLIADEVNDENLQAHADKFKRFFADGQTNIDLVQFLARDGQTGAWTPDGHEQAEQRAIAAMKAIEGGASFDDTLASSGEYYANDKDKGRLGSKSLNQLRQSLRESEFTDLLYGFSVGNYLYYDAEVGKIVGPLRGPEGWYVARVNSRVPARSNVSVAEERTRELVRQDYVNHRFLQWANEIVAKASIQ